jgi:hypothetical protein
MRYMTHATPCANLSRSDPSEPSYLAAEAVAALSQAAGGNAALVAALEQGLAGMTGMSSGFIESLPRKVLDWQPPDPRRPGHSIHPHAHLILYNAQGCCLPRQWESVHSNLYAVVLTAVSERTLQVRRRIRYLEELQNKYDELDEEFEEEMRALEKKYRALYGEWCDAPALRRGQPDRSQGHHDIPEALRAVAAP